MSTSVRDPAERDLYAAAALAEIPRLLGAVDRDPLSPTYGCTDRQFWHYRTSSFPSDMYQEAALALALVYGRPMPGNRWQGEPRVRELAIAAIRFAARSSHADGSCDDYYPFERALGAAVFSLQAAARAYEVLHLDDPELRDWLRRRADWIANNDESGHLANHQALAALGLLRVARLIGDESLRAAANDRLQKVLSWQSEEGWFDEYGGADPGYQTVTIDCLANYRRLTKNLSLDEPLRRAVAFARCFLHPDNSYGGEYGSRGTYHFYPHGFELLAGELTEAADLADGFLRALGAGKQAHFSDDRLVAHRLASLMEAYADWSPARPAPRPESPGLGTITYPRAGLLVRRTADTHTIISAARGGVVKHFCTGHRPATDTGLVLETTRGRVAVSQMHSAGGFGAMPVGNTHSLPVFSITRQLHWVRDRTATPLGQALFHLGMLLVGRWCRTLVRRLLQQWLITGRRECPIRFTRTFEFLTRPSPEHGPGLRVTDTVELLDRRLRVRRMALGTDHQAAYVAACGVYQDSVLEPWTDLASHVNELNARRHVAIVHEFS